MTVLLRRELGIMGIGSIGGLYTGEVVVGAVCCGRHGRRVCEVTFDHGGRAWVTGETRGSMP